MAHVLYCVVPRRAILSSILFVVPISLFCFGGSSSVYKMCVLWGKDGRFFFVVVAAA